MKVGGNHFGMLDDSAVDKAQQKAVIGWVLDELLTDIEKNREDVVCLVYGIAYRSVSNSGQARVVFQSKTGGYDGLKPVVMLQLVQSLSETARKGGYAFLNGRSWWQKIAFHLMMRLPTL